MKQISEPKTLYYHGSCLLKLAKMKLESKHLFGHEHVKKLLQESRRLLKKAIELEPTKVTLAHLDFATASLMYVELGLDLSEKDSCLLEAEKVLLEVESVHRGILR